MITYEVQYRYKKHSDFANELMIALEDINLRASGPIYNSSILGCRVLIKAINVYEAEVSPELMALVDSFDAEIRDNMGGVMIYFENPLNGQA